MSEAAISPTPGPTPTPAPIAGFAGEERRLHPLTLLLAIVGLGPRVFSFLPVILGLGVAGRGEWIFPALAVYLAFTLAMRWIAWTRFSWTVDDDDVSIAQGVFSRHHRTIPFDRIQDVTIEQGLIARALGLAKVGFETGSAGGGEAEEGVLDAIALADAQALRDHIRAHRGTTRPVAAEATGVSTPARDRELFTMRPGRLLVAGVFDFSLAIFAVLFGLLQTFDDLLPFDPFSAAAWERLMEGTGMEAWIAAHRWMALVGGLVSILLLGLLTGIVRTGLRDWGFRLDRAERGFRRRRGLTTRTDVTIPLARVQAALVGTGLLRRVFGWFDLRLQSLAGDGDGHSSHVVAPLARLGEADAILAELALDRAGWEDGRADRPQWRRAHPASVLVTPAAVFLIVAAIVTGNILLHRAFPAEGWPSADPVRLIAAPFLAALAALLFGWARWLRRRWHFDGRLLHIADGFLRQRHIILPARNVQSADVAVGPLARRLDIADLHLGVPGGGSSLYRVPAIRGAEARALRRRLLAAR